VFLAAANHLSYLDILVLGSLWPGVFVAKHEIARWPLFGVAAGTAGTIFIDRDVAREVVAAGRQVSAVLDSGQPVTLFPEGRITAGASVLPFLPALLAPAARGRVPCHAISLRYDTSEPGVDPATQVCWPDATPLIPHALRVATMRDLRVTVHVSEEPLISDDRKELAGRLHAWVAARFRPMTAPDDAEPSCAP
jgi:1-acyl-sn-glycerol-3-phosphate acyltransferase